MVEVNVEELIDMYEDKIKRLSEDKPFGILNRNGLEEEIFKINEEFDAIFLDFDGIHELNHAIGYENVNEIIKNIFTKFSRDDVLIGRWFSGDEIILIPLSGNKIDFILDRLHRYIDLSGLKFKYLVINNCNSINDLRMGTRGNFIRSKSRPHSEEQGITVIW